MRLCMQVATANFGQGGVEHSQPRGSCFWRGECELWIRLERASACPGTGGAVHNVQPAVLHKNNSKYSAQVTGKALSQTN